MAFLPGFRRHSVVSGGEWKTYEYPLETGGRGFVAFDVGHADEAQHVVGPHGRRVVLEAKTLPDGVTPADAHVESLMEALIEAKARGVLVGTHRFDGVVEYVFQVEQPAAFDAVIDAWLARSKAPARLERHEGWTYFDDVLRPDARDEAWMEEAAVIARLVEAGSNLKKPHELEHVFVGTPEQLGTIADALLDRGFRIVERDNATLTVARAVLIENRDVTATTMPLRRLAEAVGAEYDGWSCDVVK
jgi:hypothetical protein